MKFILFLVVFLIGCEKPVYSEMSPNKNHSEIINNQSYNIEKKIKTIRLPTSSSYYINCLKKKSSLDCDNLSEIEDYYYSFDTLKKEYPSLAILLEKNDDPIDTVRFIDINGQLKYALIQSMFDDIDLFYLKRIDLESNDFIFLDKYYSIDSKGMLSYKKDEKIKKINLND